MSVIRWKGPDVLVMGWIPFHAQIPSGATGYANVPGSTLLFQSGNPSPPIAFVDHQDFLNWPRPPNPVGTKEYRAAAYVRNVEARFLDGSPPMAVVGGDRRLMGYTPLRLLLGGVNVLGALPGVSSYLRGAGPPGVRSAPVSDVAGNWIEFTYRAEFKLSHLPNLVSRMLTGQWAPYAWCEIRYRLEKSGAIYVNVEGSAVPSLRLYIDWALPHANSAAGIVPEYDMLTAAAGDVSGFIQTLGWGCQPAPLASHLSWSGYCQAVASNP